MKLVERVNTGHALFQEYWRTCQRCKQTLHTDVGNCSNFDCPIFFRRLKARSDFQESYALLSQSFDF